MRRPEKPLLTRRGFLRLLAAGGGLSLCAVRPSFPRTFDIPGEIHNPSPVAGHLLRGQQSWASFPSVEGKPFDAVVIGGGISGLSAAWKLERAGVDRVLLLELEEELGGNSISGVQGSEAFPWAAHYINIPPQEADCIHELLLDLGVIKGYDLQGRPEVAEECLLRWPHERLAIDGEWVEGLDPFVGVSEREMETLRLFEDDMLGWTLYRGRDGRRAFAMPLAYSTREERVRELDAITMEGYLRSRGWRSERLDWLVDYACRDDYGGLSSQVSAWAGIHYWACRFYDNRLWDEYPPDTLTWVEGNAFLARGLADRLKPGRCRTGCLVLRVEIDGAGLLIRFIDLKNGRQHAIRSRTAVYAGKLHTAPFVVQGLPSKQREAMAGLTYSPWLVAAVHLSGLPDEKGRGMAWDNVFFGSPSLGYVRADHQDPRKDGRATLVYYRPFVDEVERARRELLNQPHAYWVQMIMNDLCRFHPGLEELVERVDVYRWGHAMVRPEPGVIWGETSRWRQRPLGGLAFATCDATGLPLFEEAVFSGVWGAERCLQRLGIAHDSSLKGWGDDRG